MIELFGKCTWMNLIDCFYGLLTTKKKFVKNLEDIYIFQLLESFTKSCLGLQ